MWLSVVLGVVFDVLLPIVKEKLDKLKSLRVEVEIGWME